MAWYDVFSSFYDKSLEKLYAEQRIQAAAALKLKEGLRVLDLPCGTGQSFDAVRHAIGGKGALLGVDASQGMLARAKARVDAHGWSNVSLLHARADELAAAEVNEALGGRPPQRILCFLGLTAFDDWEASFDHMWSLLAPGGRLVIVDVHAERPGFQGKMVEWIAQADLKRQVWAPLEARSKGFTFERFHAHWQHGGDVVIAAGDKPT